MITVAVWIAVAMSLISLLMMIGYLIKQHSVDEKCEYLLMQAERLEKEVEEQLKKHKGDKK